MLMNLRPTNKQIFDGFKLKAPLIFPSAAKEMYRYRLFSAKANNTAIEGNPANYHDIFYLHCGNLLPLLFIVLFYEKCPTTTIQNEFITREIEGYPVGYSGHQ
ncbi:MAG: hypothetical protein A3G70_06675 [Planctomycetes bacterium RIFCSPLOWO2_12_FULL_39_13]|nr:MAG: hypothetical protein A3G70_06675 [Planctomycetes bacterium RIFCSPLOWO2_12_FULL_39_13]